MSAPRQLAQSGGRQPEILLVEDEQIVAFELHNRLTKLGYQVTKVAASGEEALRCIEARRPDLILMDYVLAGRMTGAQTAKLVAERFDIPVVYLTAYSDAATIEEIKAAEGQGFLTKPFQPQDLHAVLQLTLARHGKEQRRREAERSAWAESSRTSKEQLQEFTYTAGHDLQEPLRTAKAFIELLARRAAPKLDDEERSLLREAQGGLTRMSELVQDLVAYAQAGAGETDALPEMAANDALDAALGNLRQAITDSDANIVPAALPRVRADSQQLVRVFQNLLGNAIKYRHEGQRPEIHVGAEERGGQVVISVRDNGIGFTPEYAEYIFTPFKRLHGPGDYPGTGIGLAICRKIVEAHGGKIWAEATPGQGAVFSFTLPGCR